MIKSLRIDERLIHGQVAMTWTKTLHLNGLVVADDAAASNEIQKMTLKMAAPSDIHTIIKTVDGAIKLLQNPKAANMNLMVITPTVKDAVKLAKAFPNEFEMVNVGNAGKMSHTDEKKHLITKETLLTDEEIKYLHELVELYPDTFFQGTPVMEKKMASAVLKDIN
ncbi:phosphotransferase enzyme IIB component [Lapidilactobacillus dextrinicus DSM 20335]|uniref:Phosphotransferase enzyme IIB component n=1 Tax=Lapidilactobacillus dextrinicus DSM 20335 TaxID=1423738 RepID=A0A0R2BH46_9LACO|nr:PTS sugar transporter subunit IIB [Lapidilactobacillus dextrinicus]KRM78625.1 phosphotransferase enzyme IIB component [Lapidilactobacillus dextrinicus DSM 20335]QFG46538.1 PTS sugar transporter subunit IIB [Lapidilactobacillus dextrinicus]